MECTKTKLEQIVNDTKEQLSKRVPISTLENKRGIVNADELIKGVWEKYGKQLQKIASAELIKSSDGNIRYIHAEKMVKHGTGDEAVIFEVSKRHTHPHDYNTQPYVKAIYIQVHNHCKHESLELAKKDVGRLHEVVEAYIKMFKAFIAVSEEDGKKNIQDRIKADKIALAILPDAKLHYVNGFSDKLSVFHYRTDNHEMIVNIETKEVSIHLEHISSTMTTQENAKALVKLHSRTLEFVAAERARHEAKIRAEQAEVAK